MPARVWRSALLAACILSSGPSGAAFTDRFGGDDIAGLFEQVARGVRYEPYAGALRGAEGCAAHGSGNDVDQALLLADLLRRRGYRVRFVQGQLDEANLTVLLRGAFPPVFPHQPFAGDLDAYVPEHDPALRLLATRHTWIEVDQGDSWLPLDPSFPRAAPGEAYAVAALRLPGIPPQEFARIRVEIIEQTGGGKRSLVDFEENVAALLLKPVSYTESRLPLMGASNIGRKTGVRDLFGGALSGTDESAETAAPPPAEEDGALLLRSLAVGAREFDVPPLLVRKDDAKSHLNNVSLKITLTQPGRTELVSERSLYRQAQRNPWPDTAFRRHTIAVWGGRVEDGMLATARSRLEPVARPALSGQAQDDAQRLMALEKNAAPAAGMALLALQANAVDTIADRAGWFAGGQWFYPAPRVYLFDLEIREQGGEYAATAAIDLRIDQAMALPLPERPRSTAQLLQRSRGLLATSTEAEILETVLGRPVHANTMRLMDAVTAQGVGVLVAEPGSRAPAVTGIDAHTRGLMRGALNGGRRVIYPAAPVELGGTAQFGWFEEDPATGAWVGVMADGRHQALSDYGLSLEETATNYDVAFVIGAMIGTIDTIGLIAAFMLEQGVITAAIIEKVQKIVNALACAGCPADIGAGASGSMSLGGDCLKVGLQREVMKDVLPGSTKDAASFCSSFQDGFKCAAGTILSALKAEAPGPEVGLGVKVGTCALHFKMGRKWDSNSPVGGDDDSGGCSDLDPSGC